jgi:hypothetical protein
VEAGALAYWESSGSTRSCLRWRWQLNPKVLAAAGIESPLLSSSRGRSG